MNFHSALDALRFLSLKFSRDDFLEKFSALCDASSQVTISSPLFSRLTPFELELVELKPFFRECYWLLRNGQMTSLFQLPKMSREKVTLSNGEPYSVPLHLEGKIPSLVSELDEELWVILGSITKGNTWWGITTEQVEKLVRFVSQIGLNNRLWIPNQPFDSFSPSFTEEFPSQVGYFSKSIPQDASLLVLQGHLKREGTEMTPELWSLCLLHNYFDFEIPLNETEPLFEVILSHPEVKKVKITSTKERFSSSSLRENPLPSIFTDKKGLEEVKIQCRDLRRAFHLLYSNNSSVKKFFVWLMEEETHYLEELLDLVENLEVKFGIYYFCPIPKKLRSRVEKYFSSPE